MSSTNGHAPKRAVLYARVSTEEQARSGYSLAQQLEALREYAAREGYEILEEVVDSGQSGASLERPGMDRVRELVEAGGVCVVLAQDRDRFAREPAYHYLLRKEFEKYGCKIRALSDRGDESPEGELTDGILDQLAKFERAKIAERTRRGRIRKAKEGKVLRTWKAPFGFDYNETRDGLVVNESEMAIMEKVFRMAAGGLGTTAIQTRLRSAGIPSPNGGTVWAQSVLRRLIFNDIYKAHHHAEVKALVSPEVAAQFDSDKEYGVWWWNRQKVKQRTVSEADGNGGRRYRKITSSTLRSREEWIAVPVPAYLSRPLVDQARAVLESNKGFERKHRAREWELRGLVRCTCGWQMSTHTANGKGGIRYSYYTCRRRQKYGQDACQQKSLRAAEVEEAVWDFVSGRLLDPEKVRAGIEKIIEEEQAAEPQTSDDERESRMWFEKLSEVDRKRSGFQDMAAEGLITFDELRSKLAGLEETRETARRELGSLARRRERIEALERDRDTLLSSYVGMIPDGLSREERNKVYRMLQLEVTPAPKGYAVSGVFCTSEPTS